METSSAKQMKSWVPSEPDLFCVSALQLLVLYLCSNHSRAQDSFSLFNFKFLQEVIFVYFYGCVLTVYFICFVEQLPKISGRHLSTATISPRCLSLGTPLCNRMVPPRCTLQYAQWPHSTLTLREWRRGHAFREGRTTCFPALPCLAQLTQVLQCSPVNSKC